MSENKVYETLKDKTLSRNRAAIEKMIKQDIRGVYLSQNARNILINKIYNYRSDKVKKIFNKKVERVLSMYHSRGKLNDAKNLLNKIKIHISPSKKVAIKKYLKTVKYKNIKNTLIKLESYGIINKKESNEYIKNTTKSGRARHDRAHKAKYGYLPGERPARMPTLAEIAKGFENRCRRNPTLKRKLEDQAKFKYNYNALKKKLLGPNSNIVNNALNKLLGPNSNIVNINNSLKKLSGPNSNFVRNSKKPSPTTTRKLMNSKNSRPKDITLNNMNTK